MTDREFYVILSLVLVGLSLFDLWITVLAIAHPAIHEINPIGQYMLEHVPMWVNVLIKGVIPYGLALLIAITGIKKVGIRVGVWVCLVFYSLVVANNLYNYFTV